ncbi:transmembrane protein 39A-A [Hyposmocoma kahamanoa]|uniref:transmembrane protein 39A-A n=1 Tax=Hyposmocoma kahamanoa TaxID=1477025 RepID=UPI000E6D97C4|nr:transmembrane protein 39A-A [Hyposmocoma kahamanoa]
MSCTENESGPFVVFFLPAVVGCLTILLARRWANSQVSNTSSTAVSRRRKIIKDPLIKRPLPPIACKMVAPGSKKAAGSSKKGTLPIPEEELNGASKRVRTTRVTPPVTTAPEVRLTDGPVPPKHIPFPYIPQDGELLFEMMTFVFTLVATCLQLLNLYRTAWWLPHSQVTEAMHFYLIDINLVAFIVVVISRRLLFSLTLAVLRGVLPAILLPNTFKPAKGLLLGMIGGVLLYLTYTMVYKYSLIKIFFLLYPAVVYLLLFGLDSSPFLELSNPSAPLHCCSHEPHLVRAEVDALRHDFNLRVKKILFNSIVGTYYSSFIPCTFAPPFLYYDVYAAAQQIGLVWFGLFGRYASQLVPAAYTDVPHRATLHLGRWRPDTTIVDMGGEVVAWSGGRLWSRGARVAARGSVFVATSNCVAATPMDSHHTRFYVVFENPSLLICVLVCMQLSLIVVQLSLLFSGSQWHYFLSIVILLFINYYTLFKQTRDYLVSSKVYKAESIIQDKNGLTASN